MVHSVYSETDIFLRELISNASDACDKLRYEAIATPDLIADGAPPKIRIAPDKKADTLAVIDNGIGMDRQELIDNLGTIARSGTKSLSVAPDRSQGRRRPDRPVRRRLLCGLHGRRPHRRHQPPRRHRPRPGSGRRRAAAVSRSRPPARRTPARVTRGTEIVLHLKNDASEISRDLRDRAHRRAPIPTTSSSRSNWSPEEGEPRQINSASALWQRPKSELTPEDYKQAYARSPAPSTSRR